MSFVSWKNKSMEESWLFIFSLFMFVILFCRTYLESFFYEKSYIGDFKFTQFLFSYENGFVKRGLIGEIFRQFFEINSYEVVCIVATVFLFILCGLLIYIFLLPYRKERDNGLFLFYFVALSAPPTIQHFIFDVGRFDVFNLIIAIVCIWLIRQKYFFSLFIVLPLLSITLLIHEASFFLFVPLVLSYWFFLDSSKGSLYLFAIVILSFVLMTYVISTYGVLSEESLLNTYEKLKDIYGVRVDFTSLTILYKGSIVGNMEYTMNLGLTWLRLIHHLIMLVFLLPLIFIVWKILAIFFKENNYKLKILIYSAFTPLILYPLGHDHFRWWSIIFTNLFLVIAFVLMDSDVFRKEVSALLLRYSSICKIAAFSGILLGPLGVTNSLLIR